MKKWAYMVTAYIILGLIVYFVGGKNVDPPPCCSSLNAGIHDPAAQPVSGAVYTGLNAMPEDDVREQVDFPRPETGVPFNDPVFGTTVVRLTGSGTSAGSGWDYIPANVFNADSTHMLIRDGEGRWTILDIPGFRFNKYLTALEGDVIPRWHPVDPHLLYYFEGNNLFIKDVITGQYKALHTFTRFSRVTGTSEGRLSEDGSRIAVLGYDTKGNPDELFTYNVKTKLEGPGVKLSGAPGGINWATVTPKGDYVVIGWGEQGNGKFQGTRLYTAEMKPIRQLIDTVRPGKLAYDVNGDPVYVVSCLDSKLRQNPNEIIKIAVPDGTVTTVQTLECRFHVNISGAASETKEWVLVSTHRSRRPGCEQPGKGGWHPYEGEIYALKIDGSGSTRRIAHHRNVVKDLSQETRVFANRDMTMAVWNSNWGESDLGAGDLYAGDLEY